MSDLIDELRGFSKAYPEDMFPPFTDAERQAHSVVISRASGAMGRHCAKHMARAADEIERLTAALRHEADCVEAAKEEIERLTAENKMLRHTHRWNVSPQVDDSLLVCRHLHEKDEKCDLEHYVPAERLHDAIRERDELRRQLAEAGESIARQAATIRGLTRPAGGS